MDANPSDKASPSMIVKIWGNRGSIPAPQADEEILEKVALGVHGTINRLSGQESVKSLFGKESPTLDDVTDYVVRNFPRSVRGTYGGETTCAEIQAVDSPLQMIDAGTGARKLGGLILRRLFTEGNINPLNTVPEYSKLLDLWLTHYHWDHIQGMPFFDPIFVPRGIDIHVHGKRDARKRLEEVLAGQQQYPNFPVVWQDIPADVKYDEMLRMDPVPRQRGKLTVTYREMSHPDSSFTYAFEVNSKKFVFATDCEIKGIEDARLIDFSRKRENGKAVGNADAIYMDAQYLPDEYKGGNPKAVTGALPKIDWGHNTYEWCVVNALAAGIPLLVLGHHEPKRGDRGLEELHQISLEFRDKLLRRPEHAGKRLDIVMSYQGLELKL
ncbi:MBL fold metallo-hydrolase [Candidatus Woesearchaeota archaeon]|nr:MBL fold metallo-hydrolase [Candidatus Woesearchaeota archaeon]